MIAKNLSHRVHALKAPVLLGIAYLVAMMFATPGRSHSGDLLSPITASQSFVEAYYLEDGNLVSTLSMTTGDAKKLAQARLTRVKAMGAGTDKLGPTSMIPLEYLANKKINDATYQVKWLYQPGKGKAYEVTTTAVKKGNIWLIETFSPNKK